MSVEADQPDAALTEALAAHGRWLRTVLVARGVEPAMLDEAMQEVSVAACRGWASFRDRERVAPWLYRLAVVAALQYRRRVGRRRKLVDRYATSGLAPLEAVDRDPLAWLLDEEEQQLVRQAIVRLPRQDAEILLLKYTENASYRELTARLGLSEAAIDGRLRRARERMRAILARLAPETAATR